MPLLLSLHTTHAMSSPSPELSLLTLSPSLDCDMFELGTHVVVGEMRPELEWAKDLMSEYSDLAWGGENVSADMIWPVVEEIGDTEESMEESLHTWGAKWGATRAIIPPVTVIW